MYHSSIPSASLISQVLTRYFSDAQTFWFPLTSRRQEMIKMRFSNEAVSDSAVFFPELSIQGLCAKRLLLAFCTTCLPLSAPGLFKATSSAHKHWSSLPLYVLYDTHHLLQPLQYSCTAIAIQHLACSSGFRPPDVAGQLRSTGLPHSKEITKGI